MPTIKMHRWLCPNDAAHAAKLAPSRPRKDDVRRYCLVCSEKSGRLVERIVPQLESRREAARERSAKKAAKRRAAMPRFFCTAFTCGLRAADAALLHAGTGIQWDVRNSSKPRAPRIDVDKRVITVYDHTGCDKYDARAIVVLAELLLLDKLSTTGPNACVLGKGSKLPTRTFIRARLKNTIGIEPAITGPIAQTWKQISWELRAKAAENTLGKNALGTTSGRMSFTAPGPWQIPRTPATTFGDRP